MTRSARIRALILERGPMTIDQLAGALHEDRRRVAGTVWTMEYAQYLVRGEGERWEIGRMPMSGSERSRLSAATRYGRTPADPAELWAVVRAHPVPAINPGPLRWVG